MQLEIQSGSARARNSASSRGAPANGLNVVHGVLHACSAIDVIHQLFERDVVQDVVGGGGELFVDEPDRHLAGGHFLGRLVVLQGKPALEAADDVADADVARRAG